MRRAVSVSLLVAALALAGCGSDDGAEVRSEEAQGSGSGSGSASGIAEEAAPAFDAEAADTVVRVEVTDFAFAPEPASAAAGRIYFEVHNAGQVEHEFEVLDPSGEPVDEITPFPGGQTRGLALELEPGVYTLQCILEEGGKTHAELGMTTPFEVR